MSLTSVIPDIHGCSDLLSEALAEIKLRSGSDAGAIVTIGDYVDKGPDSKGVIERLLAGVGAGGELGTVKGPRDDMMVGGVWGPPKMRAWRGNGCDAEPSPSDV